MGGSSKCQECENFNDEGYGYDSLAYGLTPSGTCARCPAGCDSCKKEGVCDKVRWR